MLSGDPKPSHGSRISQQLFIFTPLCRFMETKAQRAHVSDPERQLLRKISGGWKHILGSPGFPEEV